MAYGLYGEDTVVVMYAGGTAAGKRLANGALEPDPSIIDTYKTFLRPLEDRGLNFIYTTPSINGEPVGCDSSDATSNTRKVL